MNERLERAELLLRQGRAAEAEREVRGALVEEPEAGLLHALLANCLLAQERRAEALQAAEVGVGFDPDMDYVHYVLARVLFLCDREEAALDACQEAVRLDPEDPDYPGLEARILFELRRFEEALVAAERGLTLDPEHAGCGLVRALVLYQLGQHDGAAEALRQVLAVDPEDAEAHALLGFVRLRRGEAEEAVESFREALRLDPTQDTARRGLQEALKGKNRLYGLFVRYLLWMQGLSDGQRWAFLLGAYFAYQGLSSVSERRPDLAPFARPVLYAYLGFVLLTWFAMPISNLLLSFDRFGRLTLDANQRRSARAVGACLLLALAAVLVGLATPFPGEEVALGLVLFAVPLQFWLAEDEELLRSFLRVVAGIQLVLGVAASAALAVGLAGSKPWLNGASALFVQFIASSILVLLLINVVHSEFMADDVLESEEQQADRWRVLTMAWVGFLPQSTMAVVLWLLNAAKPMTFGRTALMAFLLWKLLQGGGWARWVLVLLSGFAVLTLGGGLLADPDPVMLCLGGPLLLALSCFALWLLGSRSLTRYLDART